MDLVTTPNPHFVPGYTGYCPQYMYRIGRTYGTLSHKLLVDPCVAHSENIIITDNKAENYREEKPTFREVDLIKTHEKETDPVYKYPVVPGYDGFIPNMNSKNGHRFLVSATESIAEFEKHQQYLKCEARKMRHRTELQDQKSLFGKTIGERSLAETIYRMPLTAVRPEAEGIIRHCREEDICREPKQPYSKDRPPHFMENDDPEKYIVKGYGGHVPFAWPRVGENNRALTNGALCEFANNYHFRKSPEWVPMSQTGVGTSKANYTNFMIYPRTTGMMPNYSGHVPGEVFRFGKTFGNDTVDAKRWLHERS